MGKKDGQTGGLVEELAAALTEGKAHPLAAYARGDEPHWNELDDVQALAVVEAARRASLPMGLWNAQRSGSKAAKKAAGAALHRLKSAGIAVEEPPRERAQWSLGATSDHPAPVGFLGLPEPDGYFPFLLVTFGDEGGVAFVGLAGAGQGFRDADHSHVTRSRARDMVQDVRRDPQMIEVPFEMALHFCERAFAEGGAEPPGWGHLLHNVPAAVRDAARAARPVAALPAVDGDALHQVGALLAPGPSQRLFSLDEKALMQGYEELVAVAGSDAPPEDRAARLDDVVRRTADAAVGDMVRRTYGLALEVAAALAHGPLGDDDLRRLAQSTAMALRDGTPGSAIPLVHETIRTVMRVDALAQG